MEQRIMDKIVALSKRRGFFYAGSEIYGGLANTYDYGPMGAELLRNIKNEWWSVFIHKREDIVPLDSSIISHHRIWEASGHVAGFADAMIDCRKCRARFRADHIIEDFIGKNKDLVDSLPKTETLTNEELRQAFESGKVEGWPVEKLAEFIRVFKIKCPNCGQQEWTDVRKFNQLFPVHLGIVVGEEDLAYLRGETAQGIFTNFKNVVDSTRVRLPFGIGQIGKSFRNEITLGNAIFRTTEFEQAELEYFFDPQQNNWEELFKGWKHTVWRFVTNTLGIKEENLRWRTHSDEERSFYSKRTEDLEYNFPFGFKELWGLAYRTDYDLKQHTEHSGKELVMVDSQTGEKIMPHVIEPAVGINRLLLMILVDAYKEDGERTMLALTPRLAPVKIAVFPLLANKEELVATAQDLFETVKDKINGKVVFDKRGNIGKRYLAQDEIGTPFCVTVDFQTLEDNTVTVRNRDTALQERVAITELLGYLYNKFGNIIA